MSTTTSKPIPMTDRNGKRVYASSVVAGDRKRYAVSTCAKCGREVAWAESKNGRFYLATVRPKLSEEYGVDRGVWRVYPFQPHNATCGR